MPRTNLTAQQMRSRAIDLALSRMRAHGFDKVRLSDVAKDMGLTHAALYAHFTDKAALLDAVAERWIGESDVTLEQVAQSPQQPLQKIEDWFVTRYRIKRDRALRDPELYRAFDTAASLKKPFVVAHLDTVTRQLVGLLREAASAAGATGATDAAAQQQARLLFEAMAAFHHPRLVPEYLQDNREELLKQVLRAMLAGLGLAPR